VKPSRPPTRPSVLSQAEVLMNILKEMDALSIELIGYTREKEYETDKFNGQTKSWRGTTT
jgi:hypothetical protein